MGKENKEDDVLTWDDAEFEELLKEAQPLWESIEKELKDLSLDDDSDFAFVKVPAPPPPLQREELPDDPAEALVLLIQHYRVIRHRKAVCELQRLYDRPDDLPVTGKQGRTGPRLNEDLLRRFRKSSAGKVAWNKRRRLWRWLEDAQT